MRVVGLLVLVLLHSYKITVLTWMIHLVERYSSPPSSRCYQAYPFILSCMEGDWSIDSSNHCFGAIPKIANRFSLVSAIIASIFGPVHLLSGALKKLCCICFRACEKTMLRRLYRTLLYLHKGFYGLSSSTEPDNLCFISHHFIHWYLRER